MSNFLGLIGGLWGIFLVILTGCSSTHSLPEPVKKTQVTNSVNSVKTNSLINNSVLLLPENPDPIIQSKIDKYINDLISKGFNPEKQGVWIQTGDKLLANYRGTSALPSASIAKVATTLAALKTFGVDHQFITKIGYRGSLENGILHGDLVIEGGEDPFFVWEEAVKVGNLLNQIGIKKVTGNLVIVSQFYMNFQESPQLSGTLLKQGLNAKTWTPEAETQYQTLDTKIPRPEIIIQGTVQVQSTLPNNIQPLLNHYSFPVAELLKKMNCYSNTQMSRMFNEAMGGEKRVNQIVIETTKIPESEIQLGGGDRISPRAAVAMFLAIDNYLQDYRMSVADVFAIAGQDPGFLEKRQLPEQSVLKSGTWENISALAGALPTPNQGTVWIALMNVGQPTEKSEFEQDRWLNDLSKDWGEMVNVSPKLTPLMTRKIKTSRIEIIR